VSRVVLCAVRQGKGRCSSVAFSTVVGHLIEGEERFSVEFREQDSSVWLDLYSVSRGSGVLGKVGRGSAGPTIVPSRAHSAMSVRLSSLARLLVHGCASGLAVGSRGILVDNKSRAHPKSVSHTASASSPGS